MARFSEKTTDIVVAVFGVQALTLPKHPLGPVRAFVEREDPNAPRFWDMGSAIDSQNYAMQTLIFYWDSKEEFTQWLTSSGFDEWWANLKPELKSVG